MKPQKKVFVSILKQKWFLIGLAVVLSLIIFGSDLLKVKAWGSDGGANASEPRQLVKAVVVTNFEVGQDTGDKPGEFQNWVEREKLDKIYPLPAANHNVRTNGKGLIGILTGDGTAKGAASIMALGLDPRFDLTKAYWLVAGIAGIDPEDASLGSAAWAEWVVDGDLANEIDAREIPPNWPYGYFPQGSSGPNKKPAGGQLNPQTLTEEGIDNLVFHLNPSLVEWAYQLTKDVKLVDFPQMAKYRAQYVGYPNAQKPPFVLKGDNVAASTYWYGKLLNQWANDWVKLWSNGKGNFVTTAEEDAGTLLGLKFLAKAGLVDLNRVMVLRTASDYSAPSPNMNTAESFVAASSKGIYPGYDSSISSAYRVGSTVIHKILDNWEKYEQTVPGM